MLFLYSCKKLTSNLKVCEFNYRLQIRTAAKKRRDWSKKEEQVPIMWVKNSKTKNNEGNIWSAYSSSVPQYCTAKLQKRREELLATWIANIAKSCKSFQLNSQEKNTQICQSIYRANYPCSFHQMQSLLKLQYWWWAC